MSEPLGDGDDRLSSREENARVVVPEVMTGGALGEPSPAHGLAKDASPVVVMAIHRAESGGERLRSSAGGNAPMCTASASPTNAGNTPSGVLSRAAQVAGPTLTEAIGEALAEMGEAGGTHLALSPTDAVAEATRTDGKGRPLYAGGVLPDLYGLTVVRVPGPEQPLVYDASTTYLVVARDFAVRASGDYAPAFKADKTALRITGPVWGRHPDAGQVGPQGDGDALVISVHPGECNLAHA